MTELQAETQETPLHLECLGGREPPDFLRGDLKLLLSLGEDARAALWDVLGPCLLETDHKKIDEIIDGFARRHDLRGSEVAQAVRGCRLLVLEAARRNAEKHALALDLGSLVPDEAEKLREALLPGYEEAREVIRADILRKTVLEHGSLLVGVDWRLDRIALSQHGVVDAPVALLTLSLQEGAERTRKTIHVELPALQALYKTLEGLLASTGQLPPRSLGDQKMNK